ncbi:MAG: BMC domain-containing protein, partial [Cyanobacteria bacterium NC_groundwater_1444_Ag_S-0.65um_54_12]|nr:BMC domain-containing protein [Cyanobacteria bacterium NC_groundwater_1444_Ag_S-0.65um_54_12]
MKRVNQHDQKSEATAEPALALIECASIALGFGVADAIVKKAPVRLLRAQTCSPGKFLVLYAGDVASVAEAHAAGIDAAGAALIDEVFLPGAHPDLLRSLQGQTAVSTLDSYGIIETFSLATAILAADIAVKATPVIILELRIPVGTGGKSFVSLTGTLEDLQVSLEQALERIRPSGMLCQHLIIPNPHEDLQS